MSVKCDIRLGIEALSVLPFNWNKFDGLPVRQDVITSASVFFNTSHGFGFSEHLLEMAGMPEIMLRQDGTVDLIFTTTRTLVLTLYCYGVVGYRKEFEDGKTEIEGIIRALDHTQLNSRAELEELLTWLVQE